MHYADDRICGRNGIIGIRNGDSTGGTKITTSHVFSTATTVYAQWTVKTVTPDMPFADVPDRAYYRDAVIWAVDGEITVGTSAATFSPMNHCTRAQIVTFIYRNMK